MMPRSLSCGILILLPLLLVVVVAGPCPTASHPGSVFSDQIVAAFNGGVIPLTESEDSQCYNYTLPYSFKTVPEVGVAVHDFESEPSRNIFFYVKPVRTESLSAIPFVVRTPWAYTAWVLIGFSFLAEDRADLETGYYQIDSGSLAGCENGKQIQVLLPFRNSYQPSANIRHHLFLHGFQITTIALGTSNRSPYELQISSSSANHTGIAVLFSVTTNTKVDSIYVSYFAYVSTTLHLEQGSHVYDAQLGGLLSVTPVNTIPRSYARLFGLSGFIVNYNAQRLEFNTKWDGFTFSFLFGSSASLVQYLSYNYIFFVGSECSECPGYPLASNGTCVNFCPVGSTSTPENICIFCGDGRVWNGSVCILECPSGQYLNTDLNRCECPPPLNWNGEICVSCSSGKVWDASIKSCECPLPLRWNGFACAKLPECDGGQIWDVYSFSCKCADYQYLRGTICVDIPVCTGGQVLTNYRCVCPSNYIWNGQICTFTPCVGGQVWTGTNCVCPAGLHFNGTMCVQCINWQKWNAATIACECQAGYKWNGQFCERTYECTGNRVWNSTYEQCICPNNYYWSGYACIPVPSCQGGQYWDRTLQTCACLLGYKFNGISCVICTNGKIWSQTTLTCSCPPGTIQTKTGLCDIQQQCSGGRVWMQNTYTCQCPASTVWNGNFCIVNPCSSGRVWNSEYKSCECPNNKVWMNQACVPPQISCTNGRIWNPAIYACQCPVGTFPLSQKCDAIPTCTGKKVYNPLNNQCNCPYGLVQKAYQCVDPNCPTGQYYNGYECQIINCPPPSFFSVDRCVYKGVNKCPFGYYFNGVSCVYYPSSCPSGTTWSSLSCTSSSQCGSGFYMGSTGQCASLPQQCTPPTTFNGIKCVGPNNACPSGTYANGGNCLPYVACKNGFIWDTTYLRCVCPAGQINNGNNCVACPHQKVWSPTEGCACPEGSFDTGAACETINQNRCSVIPNAIWSADKCACRPGFTKVGFQCVCYGTQNGNLCDKCSYKPNSLLNAATNICECRNGYTQIGEHCVPVGQNTGSDDPTRCAVGTYFDSNHKMCLACPDGCLSCSNCYTCKTCRPEFIFDPKTSICFELCGDGKKFIHSCDDGNNVDGDGCSRDCQVEAGYTCAGGSPDGPDNCFNSVPARVSITQTGQVRLSTSIVLNLRVNYIPNSLLIADECKNSCGQILTGEITSGDSSSLAISSKYLGGTTYDFTMTIEFGRPYIGQFSVRVDLNRSEVGKFFGSIPIDPVTINIIPSYLAAVADSKDTL